MKKILLALALVCIVLVAASGGAYAVDHQVVRGNKLLGTGQFGVVAYTDESGAHAVVSITNFIITNTACRDSVTIKQLSILDSMGNVVYEGPLYKVVPEVVSGWTVDFANPDYTAVDIIGPHQTISIPLMYMFPEDSPDGWEDWPDSVQRIAQIYTLEVVWAGVPTLAGIVETTTQHLSFDAGGIVVEREFSTDETPMVKC